jgi:hexosaminidase
VLPEIDLPGHSAYFQRAFGFDMQDPRGMKILEAALTEFMDQVQTPALHIGSDEVHLRNPKFLDHFADLVRARGRRVVVWRPGGIPKGELITQAWSAGGKPNGPLPGMAWLDSRHNYVNHMDPFDGPCRILNLAVCDQPAGDDRNLGGILCHWPDIHTPREADLYRAEPGHAGAGRGGGELLARRHAGAQGVVGPAAARGRSGARRSTRTSSDA